MKATRSAQTRNASRTRKAKNGTDAARRGYPYLTAAEMRRRRREGDARRARMTPEETRAMLISWGILNPDGTLHRPKMDHVPYGPRE